MSFTCLTFTTDLSNAKTYDFPAFLAARQARVALVGGTSHLRGTPALLDAVGLTQSRGEQSNAREKCKWQATLPRTETQTYFLSHCDCILKQVLPTVLMETS